MSRDERTNSVACTSTSLASLIIFFVLTVLILLVFFLEFISSFLFFSLSLSLSLSNQCHLRLFIGHFLLTRTFIHLHSLSHTSHVLDGWNYLRWNTILLTKSTTTTLQFKCSHKRTAQEICKCIEWNASNRERARARATIDFQLFSVIIWWKEYYYTPRVETFFECAIAIKCRR